MIKLQNYPSVKVFFKLLQQIIKIKTDTELNRENGQLLLENCKYKGKEFLEY